MMTEAEQLDRFGTAAGLQIRLPYADSRLIPLLFNVPKAVRAPNGLPKGLLYDAFRDLLPEKMPVKLCRPSSSLYAQRVKAQLFAVLRDSEQPIHKLLSSSVARALLTEEIEYSEPLFAYLLQVNIWLNRYKVKLLL